MDGLRIPSLPKIPRGQGCCWLGVAPALFAVTVVEPPPPAAAVSGSPPVTRLLAPPQRREVGPAETKKYIFYFLSGKTHVIIQKCTNQF